MPSVTYIEFNGTEHAVEVPLGLSVMRGAVNNNVPGIDADCGGECACATCHVYVDPAWLDKTGKPVPGSQEASMLSFAAEAEFNSRLSCQIAMREELDGLVVRMRKEIGLQARVIATGGFATLLAPQSDTIDEVAEFLTLDGLRLIYTRNSGQ